MKNKMIKFHCVRCGKKIECPDSYAGKHSRCPACKEPITVPESVLMEDSSTISSKIYCSVCGSSMPKQSLICIKCGSENITLKKGKQSMEEKNVGKFQIFCAYFLAFFIPIFGIIAGIILTCKKETGHGLAALIISVFSFIFWAIVYSGG
jgi:hypothetical protein